MCESRHQPAYTITMLERALRDVHFNVDPKKAAKQQALEVWEVWVYGMEVWNILNVLKYPISQP